MAYFIGAISCIPSDVVLHYGVPGMKWGVRRTPEELGHRKNSSLVVDLQRFGKKQIDEGEKYTRRLFNSDGTMVVTDDWKDREYTRVPLKYKPYAVIETVSGKHRQIDRTIYDGRAYIQKQIHSEGHDKYLDPDYRNGGAHAHGFKNGKRVSYRPQRSVKGTVKVLDGRNLNEKEVREHADIIKKPYGRRD